MDCDHPLQVIGIEIEQLLDVANRIVLLTRILPKEGWKVIANLVE